MKRILIALLIAALLVPLQGYAGTVVLKNGNVISGNVNRNENRFVELVYEFGRMFISKSYVDNVKLEEGDFATGPRVKTQKDEIDFSSVDNIFNKEYELYRKEMIEAKKQQLFAAEKSLVKLSQPRAFDNVRARMKVPVEWAVRTEGSLVVMTAPDRDKETGFIMRATLGRKKEPPKIARQEQVLISSAMLAENIPSWTPMDNETRLVTDIIDENLVKTAEIKGTVDYGAEKALCLKYLTWDEGYLYTITFTYLPGQAQDYEYIFEIMARSLKPF